MHRAPAGVPRCLATSAPSHTQSDEAQFFWRLFWGRSFFVRSREGRVVAPPFMPSSSAVQANLGHLVFGPASGALLALHALSVADRGKPYRPFIRGRGWAGWSHRPSCPSIAGRGHSWMFFLRAQVRMVLWPLPCPVCRWPSQTLPTLFSWVGVVVLAGVLERAFSEVEPR